MFKLKVVAAALAGAMSAWLAPSALAQSGKISDGVVKIGVQTDLSGIYSDLAGQGSVLAAKMAVEDFGGKVNGAPIEVIAGDTQNKPDVASNMARRWFDEDKVDMIVDLPGSAAALAAVKVAKEKNRIAMVSSGGTTRLTNEDCTDRTVHWAYDTYALANGTARAVTQQGGDTWFFITPDYAFGHSMEKDASEAIKAAGGKGLGSVRHPFPGSDFSTFLLQAQSSGAKVIGLANAASDMMTTIKQANEFGISPKQRLASMIVMITDIHAMGLKTAQGLLSTDGFYWDLNDQTREWTARFEALDGDKPTMVQAGVYAGVLHYLKAVEAAGTNEADAVVAKMKELPTDDPLFGQGQIRADGRKIHDVYLFRVKSPDQSTGAWDYYETLATIPADQAFRPLEEGNCPLVQ